MTATTIAARGRTDIPKVSGGGRVLGYLQELRHDPLRLLARVREECGDVGEFRMLDRSVVLLSGERGQEAFFRARDDQLDPQPTSNSMMRPIFGEGVVYDLPPERRRETLRTPALRDENLRKSASRIARETVRMLATLGDEGEIDLLDFTTELTLYTSSATLIGPSFREQIGPEFARAYHDLEKGTDAVGYLDASLQVEPFLTRDRARRRLGELVDEILAARKRSGEPGRDMLGVLLTLTGADGSPRFTPDQMTGILVSTMFAGHHTSAATSAWTTIELLRHPAHLARIRDELARLGAERADATERVDAIDGDHVGDAADPTAGGRTDCTASTGGSAPDADDLVTYQALREIPTLENAIKEALRLHPPLIMLPRTAVTDFTVGDWTIEAGKLVAVSPALSHRDRSCFAEPDRFDPDRYAEGREEDRRHRWAWIPFGGGLHHCLGASFAMVQLKAIFAVMLPRFDFELAQAPESYVDDTSRMIVLPAQPCRVRYRRRR